MQIGLQASSAFTYLFRDQHRVIPLIRINEKRVRLNLSDPLTGKNRQVDLEFDRRDQRTLLVFDGDALWQGMPRSATYLQTVGPFEIPLSRDQLRNPREFEEAPPASIKLRDDGQSVYLELKRHFVLMPAAEMVFRHFDPHGLTKYVFVDVKRDKEKSVVILRNSSY